MVGWGNVRTLTPPNRQTIKYYASYRRRASVFKEYDHERGEKRRYYKKNNYRFNISVSRANKLTGLLPHNKRNKIIFRSPPDNHRNNYARRN
jgi:hypothetical protein